MKKSESIKKTLVIEIKNCWIGAKIILLYLIFGPPIGGIVVSSLMMTDDIRFLFYVPIFMLMSYAIGTIPALTTGIFIAILVAFFGVNYFRSAFIISFFQVAVLISGYFAPSIAKMSVGGMLAIAAHYVIPTVMLAWVASKIIGHRISAPTASVP